MSYISLRIPWASGELLFRADEIDLMLSIAGTHPFLLQQVTNLLFEAKQTQDSEKVDYEHPQNEIQQNLLSHFEDGWAMLNNIERQSVIRSIAQIIAKDSQQNNQNSRSIERLTIVPPVDISKVDTSKFKEVLKYIDNLEKLGESFLTGALP